MAEIKITIKGLPEVYKEYEYITVDCKSDFANTDTIFTFYGMYHSAERAYHSAIAVPGRIVIKVK